MKNCIILFVTLLLVSSCSNNSDSNPGLVFANHMESMCAWSENHPTNIIKAENAHSGRFVCKVNAELPYSSTFYMNLGDVSTKKLQKLKVSCWVLAQGKEVAPYIIIDILDKNKKTIEYISKDCNEEMNAVNEWYQVTNTVKMGSALRSNPENYLKVYVINSNPQTVLVDDLIVEFVE